MRTRFPFLLAAATLPLLPVRPSAAAVSGEGDLEKEYAQVRKIALKDPKVQEAFHKANDRLDARILQIDPALKPIVDKHNAAPSPVEPQRTPRPTPPSVPEAAGHHHIVVKGETLGSIAEHYNVKVATLEKVNHITDDRKLRIGQKLLIPSSENLETEPAAASPTPTPANDGSLLNRLKNL